MRLNVGAPGSGDDGRRPESQAQRAYRRLRDMIVTGILPPGAMYLEAEIAEMLGMSRTPVHEAAIRLENQGLIEVRPRRGMKVCPISPDDISEIYEILTELETLAAAKLAERRPDDATLALLAEPVAEMDAALASGDRERWAEADMRFHSELVRQAGNRRILQVVSTFEAQAHRARLATLRLRPEPHGSNEDHRNLVEALRAGDAARAAEIHRTHRINAKTLLLGLLSQHNFHQV